MALITLRIIDGADRGRTYEGLRTPITIGREEGNTIQVNDDRVSRFHAKIQEDREKLVLTDLESTNGTLVNGEETQIRILRYGDLVTVGRTVLVFGSRDEIAERLASIRDQLPDGGAIGQADLPPQIADGVSLDFELGWSRDPELQSTLHTLQPPTVPDRLDTIQAAQLSELIEYLHIRLRQLISTVAATPDSQRITLDLRQWQNLVDLQSRLATLLRAIANQDRNPNPEP